MKSGSLEWGDTIGPICRAEPGMVLHVSTFRYTAMFYLGTSLNAFSRSPRDKTVMKSVWLCVLGRTLRRTLLCAHTGGVKDAEASYSNTASI